jgi:REP element-mobilizing transposase RayT
MSRHEPVLVTSRLCAGLPRLRRSEELAVLQRAFSAGAERFGLRLVHFSIQENHLHFLVEIQNEHSLSRGIKGLLVRVARALNRLWDRKGAVIADRYHARVLRTPCEVRTALVYVLQNARKHGCSLHEADPFSSARWFDGWMHPLLPLSTSARWHSPPVVEARTWLLRVGWRRHGLIFLSERPAPEREVG